MRVFPRRQAFVLLSDVSNVSSALSPHTQTCGPPSRHRRAYLPNLHTKGFAIRQDLNLHGLLTVSVFYTVLNAAPLRILTTYISVYPSATISSLSFQAVSLSRELPYMFVRGSADATMVL